MKGALRTLEMAQMQKSLYSLCFIFKLVLKAM